jgi:hypothetical protein
LQKEGFRLVEKMELPGVIVLRPLLGALPEELVLEKPEALFQKLDAGLIALPLIQNRRFPITDDPFECFKIIG